AAEYALRLAGVRPAATPSVPRGIDVELGEQHGLAVVVPLGGRAVGGARKRTLALGNLEIGAYLSDDGRWLVLPASRGEVCELIGKADTYRLTPNNTLIPIID